MLMLVNRDLQNQPQPGENIVSHYVQEAIRGKATVALLDLGDQELKNIARPVRLWRTATNSAAKASVTPTRQIRSAPGQPSIAVLPFLNMSGDPEQEYFSDGISEDLITELSRFRNLAVIARNSTFIYKGRPVGVRQIKRELGVRYLLEGSIRKAANRIRFTGQVIDAETSAQLWSERFDGELRDVFDLQGLAKALDRIFGGFAHWFRSSTRALKGVRTAS